VYPTMVDSNWSRDGSFIQNRALNERGVKQLVERFANGLDRSSPKNHMSGTMGETEVVKLLNCIQEVRDLLCERGEDGGNIMYGYEELKAGLGKLNDRHEYPVVSEDVWATYDGESLTLQAGQHRFEALKQIKENKEDQWWPIRIYRGPLSLRALDRLRENVDEVHLSLKDGQRFLHCMLYQHQVEKLQVRYNSVESIEEKERLGRQIDEMKGTLELKYREFSHGSSTRAKAVRARPKLADSIYRAICIPGIAEEFSFGSMGDVLAYRYLEVGPVY